MDAIVAVYSDWGIGCCGTQPVTLRADRRRFREVTDGAAVIVGRKTLADFPGGAPLKNRVNIVLTRQDMDIEGAAVIVGRKTLADFPGGRPLKNRVNIVLTRQDIEIEGAVVVHDTAAALAEAGKHPRAIVIGGESVYRQLLPHVGRVFVTKIDTAPHSDAFFPDLDASPDWRLSDAGDKLEEDGIRYRFTVYERT